MLDEFLQGFFYSYAVVEFVHNYPLLFNNRVTQWRKLVAMDCIGGIRVKGVENKIKVRHMICDVLIFHYVSIHVNGQFIIMCSLC